MTLGWAVIGTGDISARLVPDLQAIPSASVRAVWSRRRDRAEAFAAAHGVAVASDDLDAILGRDDVDAAYIATPTPTHRETALRALRAGLHVLVEKPMATDAAAAAEIFATARRERRFAMEAMWMRFNPLLTDLVARVASGAIGEVRSVRAAFGMPFRATAGRATEAGSSSAWLDRGIYPVSLAHWLLGESLDVRADPPDPDPAESGGSATLLRADGAVAQVACASASFLEPSASIGGRGGWVTIDPMFWAATAARVHAGSLSEVFSRPQALSRTAAGNGYREMLAAVHAAIDAGAIEHPDHGERATTAVLRTLDAIAGQRARARVQKIS